MAFSGARVQLMRTYYYYYYYYYYVVTVVVILVAVNVGLMKGEKILGADTFDFDGDGDLGMQQEFKVHIPARAEDCYFQKAAAGTKIEVIFEVLRGGDRSVNMVLKNSQGQTLTAHSWKQEGELLFNVTYTDTYVVCFDNVGGGFAGKLVYINIAVYFLENLEKFYKEMDDLNLIAVNTTKSLSSVEESVKSMKKALNLQRFHLVRDLYLVKGNAHYVQYWSILQCAIILATSLGQIYYVRRLFRPVNVTPSAKPRA